MASNTDREMILADFQACTGIENIDEAITLLEQNNWDLLAAINGVIPQENGILQSEFNSESVQNPVFGPTALPNTSASIASSSSAFRPVVPSRQVVERLSRMLDFKVEYRDKTADVVLEDSCTVGDIKQILENDLQVPASKMLLKGWKCGDVEDSTVLRTLHLPKHNNLYVLTPDLPLPSMSSQSSSQQESLNQNYMLIITHREVKREYNLQFSGNCTIQEVKRNVYDLTSIPVRHQAWEGWPPSAQSDSMTLASSGINFPCHRLTVGRRTSPVQTREQSDESTDIHMISDSDGDDFEDATEFGVDDGEIFGMSSALRKSPMMPENAENEADALLQFTAEFSSRYGECHPVFFIGSLEASFQEAFYGKARDRKLLAIYLHHDESVLANVFCSQMLCAETIVSYLSQNFITWAWDMTREANRARFLTMCTRHFGSVVAQTIRTQKTDQFPLFLIIMGKRSSNEVLNVIQGNTSVDELMMRLISAMEIFSAQQQEDIKDEDEREARENVKREQDEAYRLSLEADRAKREAQEREMAEQYRLEQIRKEQEQEREAIRLSLEQALPPEPPEEQSEPLSKLRIRTPSGEFIERRFLSSNPLQVVFNFVASKGFPCHEYKLLSTFPRRDITQVDPSRTLMELKLYPQETLFLEAKE